MNIVEVFLPLDRRDGQPFEGDLVEGIVAGLADRFGGATAFSRAPAEGLWKQRTTIKRDRIIIVEVVVDQVDDAWWRDYRKRLEAEFEQDEIMIRVTPCRVI